ncbi:hypothetical protein BJV77DRAFT_1057652 [Russula vinacea]|nr:hypothetical protein BJV77DRAFT_1057652 [Russula vinacea]
MNRIPAPPITEEWPDADFDLTEDGPLHALDSESDKDDVEDWDIEMDLGETGGAKVRTVLPSLVAPFARIFPLSQQPITIRPPLQPTLDEDDEEEEGVSTIKMDTLRPKVDTNSVAPATIDEDFESAFALPSDLTKLSLRPLSHQSSKNSLEWGDKDQTSSSQSSDTYSTLGFDQGSTSSTSTSLPETETEDDDEDEGELEGLVIPSALFGSGSVVDNTPKIPCVDPEDDIEIGLVIDDDVDFSPSRLLQNTQRPPSKRQSGSGARTKNIASRPPTVKPSSKTRPDRTKSPVPPPASSRQLQKIRLSPSPPPPLLSAPATSSSSFLAAKSGGLRGQKSHSGLKPISPPPSHKRLTRKASLSSLMEVNQSQVSGIEPNPSFAPPPVPSAQFPRYDAPTASSRAKTHGSSTSRLRSIDYGVPPTRPPTPSSNPAALRLTMPTSSSRLKARPSISSVFPPPSSVTPLSLRSRSGTGSSSASTSAPKVLKKPKRQRLYGNGTELDAFDDLPTDRDKERQYRVQPKGHGSRGTIRKKSTRSLSTSGSVYQGPEAPPRSLKRTGRIELPPKLPVSDCSPPQRKGPSLLNHTRRKPTLIRNLGGLNAAKTVGEMRWNPQTLRWEGNDQALREFDVAMAPTRPALITHLTGSSIGSPVGSFASGARRVGNMIFDPGRMCWISTEDEEQTFLPTSLMTRMAMLGRPRAALSAASHVELHQDLSLKQAVVQPRAESSHLCQHAAVRKVNQTLEANVAPVHRWLRCRRHIPGLLYGCGRAHRHEMRGWKGKYDKASSAKSRSYLYDIRALATRKY